MKTGKATAKRILTLCNQYGITVNQLCTISGVTQSTVNSIINGESKSPRISTIKKLCDGLEITLIEFFDHPIFINLEQEIK